MGAALPVLRVGPHLLGDPDRDRFLPSKGHGPVAYYAVLTALGLLDEIAVGLARGLDLTGRPRPRVVVLVGDAELDEGSNWEAVQVAGRWGLGRLTVLVVDNDSASLGWSGGIAARFVAEGWRSSDVDGRDHDDLFRGFTSGTAGRSHVVVAHVKRKDA